MTAIKITGVKVPYLVKESYQTIKRRIFNADIFVEVTLGGVKVCLNKGIIEEFGALAKIENKEKKSKK